MIFDRIDRHAKLVNDMADKLDIDLIEETLQGHLHPDNVRSRVIRCMGCSDRTKCREMMDAAANGLDTPPSFCRNGSEFKDVLRRK